MDLDRMSTVQSQLSMDPDLHHVFMVGAQDPARPSRTEGARFSWALYELFGAGEGLPTLRAAADGTA